MASCNATSSPAPLPLPSACTYAFGAPSFLSFDLAPLAGAWRQCDDGSGGSDGAFAFSLCAALPAAPRAGCKDSALTASIALTAVNGECVTNYGAAGAASATLLEQGLALTYAGGDPCASRVFSTIFSLTCAPELPPGALVVDSISQAECELQYSARTAAACGRVVPRVVQPLGVAAAALLGVGAAVALYFALGTLYNRRVRGSRGLEAVPHIAALRRAGAAVAAATGGRVACACAGCGAPPAESEEYKELAPAEEAYFT